MSFSAASMSPLTLSLPVMYAVSGFWRPSMMLLERRFRRGDRAVAAGVALGDLDLPVVDLDRPDPAARDVEHVARVHPRRVSAAVDALGQRLEELFRRLGHGPEAISRGGHLGSEPARRPRRGQERRQHGAEDGRRGADVERRLAGRRSRRRRRGSPPRSRRGRWTGRSRARTPCRCGAAGTPGSSPS